jgi:hypothetical protein
MQRPDILFPQFKKLELEDQTLIDEYMEKFLPMSDYNFEGLWSYNIEDKVYLSILNGNLVLKSQDYLTKEPFLSFTGTNMVEETIDTLLSYAKENGYCRHLKLIPEITLYKRDDLFAKYQIHEDPDNFDYIYSVDDLINLAGNEFRGKRNFVNRFNKKFPNHTYKVMDLHDRRVKDQLLEIFHLWEKNAKKDSGETETELRAMQRTMDQADNPHLFVVGVFVEEKMIAFSINETTFHEFGIIHFEKADTNYEGSYQYLKQVTALELKNRGCKLINYEQDLGLENLRIAKKSWHPIGYLKKYSVGEMVNTPAKFQGT